jgi:hypothetical protein
VTLSATVTLPLSPRPTPAFASALTSYRAGLSPQRLIAEALKPDVNLAHHRTYTSYGSSSLIIMTGSDVREHADRVSTHRVVFALAIALLFCRKPK